MDEGTNKMWGIYTMDYYLAIKKNEVLICTAAWVNIENTMYMYAKWKMNIVWFNVYEMFLRDKVDQWVLRLEEMTMT